MSHTTSPENYINFSGKDWRVLREHLQFQMETLVDRLCGDCTNDEANSLRGELRRIKAILNLEDMAVFNLTSTATYPTGV